MPVFGRPTINVGDRQKGRITPDSVINVPALKESVERAIRLGMTEDFRKKALTQDNPYGEGKSTSKIMDILAGTDLSTIIKKDFFDINFDLTRYD